MVRFVNETVILNLHNSLPLTEFPNYSCYKLRDFQYGHIEELNVCENLGDHLIGNVYCKVCIVPIRE